MSPTPTIPALPSNILFSGTLEGPNATVDLTYTYHMSKWSCVRDMYYIHIFLVYVVFWSGLLCFVTRMFTPIKFLHPWLGKVYISAMIMATACSMLIHNEGLPTGVVVSFVVCLSAMCFGFFVIKVYEMQMQASAMDLVGKWIATKKIDPASYPILRAINEAKGHIAMSKDAASRVISLKAAHGCLMLMSWFNIAGRIVVTGVNDEFTCFSFPGYKPRNATEYVTKGMNLEGIYPIKLLPLESEKYSNSPWAFREGMWALQLGVGPVVVAAIIGAALSFLFASLERGQAAKMDLGSDAGNSEKLS